MEDQAASKRKLREAEMETAHAKRIKYMKLHGSIPTMAQLDPFGKDSFILLARMF